MSSKHDMSRRDFVKICGALTLAASAPVMMKPVAEAAQKPGQYHQTLLKMGTTVTITVVAGSPDSAKAAIDKAWAEMDRLIAVFDRHQDGTPVSELNRTGSLAAPSPEMLEVMGRAAEIHRLSEGAFDPTVLPLLDVMQRSFSLTGKAPDESELREALKKVDFGAVDYSPSLVRLGVSGQEISLDGVAKGYIVDRAAEVLRREGFGNAMINAGGDILALGHNGAGRPWRIAIQDPFHAGQYLRIINLSDMAVATSGSYEIFFDPQKEYHHLLDPKTGHSAERLVSATVIDSSAARADALATAVFVRPELFQKSMGLEGMSVDAGGRQMLTPGFRAMVEQA